MRRCRKRTISLVCTGLYTVCTNSIFTFLNSPYPPLLVGMLLSLVQGLFRLDLAVNLREFPFTALCADAGKGLFRGSVPVCALFAQTQSLNF